MVMLGHYYYFPIPYYNSFLQSIHLPIFFIINGYFLHHEWNVSTLKKETASYLLPYFVTSAIILLLGIAKNDSLTTNLLAILWGKSTMHVPYPDAIFAKFPRIGAIWFLWALWWSRQFVHFSIKFNHILLFPIAFFFIGVCALCSGSF